MPTDKERIEELEKELSKLKVRLDKLEKKEPKHKPWPYDPPNPQI